MKTLEQTTKRIKKTKGTRYNRHDFVSTTTAAHLASRRDGRLRFVHATYYGYAISLKRTKFQLSWWTNGTDFGSWEAFASAGTVESNYSSEGGAA